MNMEEIAVKVQELSEALVLADASDLSALASIHTMFQTVAEWAEAHGRPEVATVSCKAADRIEAIILEDAGEPNAAYRQVCEAAAFVQSLVCDGRVASELPLPALLGGTAVPECSSETVAERVQEIEDDSHALEGDLDLMGEFVLEANEHLDNADVHLLTLETNSQNSEALNAVFRAFHTIKGVAGMLGLKAIQKVAHEAESLLDKARMGAIELSGGAMDVTFEAVDVLKSLVKGVSEALSNGCFVPGPSSVGTVVERLHAVLNKNAQDAKTLPARPGQKLGEILVDAGAIRANEIEAALHAQWMTETPKRLGEVLVEDAYISPRAVQEALARQARDPEAGKVGEILVEMGHLRPDELDAAMVRQREEPARPGFGEVLVREHKVAARVVAQALRGQKAAVCAKQAQEPVKVDAARLDLLIDTIGEMVVTYSMLKQSVAEAASGHANLGRHLSQMDKTTRELQEMGMGLRMVPVRATFQKMARLVRDLAKKSGRDVDFVTAGDDTELDKSVVDRIGDPLIHMVRNAVDHGLEASAAERIAAGKSPRGRVELRAFHKGGSIYLEIEDDGRGLDKEAILAKARERGIVKAGEVLSDREVWNLIFAPGFSTAKQVTDVSGRGVGMDVVKRNVESLRGRIEIHTELGKGTRFSICLPLTLAIIDGMVVRVGAERYVLPTLSIVTSIRPKPEDLFTVIGRGEMLRLQGTLYPVFRLGDLFEVSDFERRPCEAIVMLVESEGERVGLVVDEILGQQQIVIKSLGGGMQGLAGIAGGAVMSDGRVGLILDIAGLLDMSKSVDCFAEEANVSGSDYSGSEIVELERRVNEGVLEGVVGL